MDRRFEEWSERVNELAELAAALETHGSELGLPPISGEAWYADLFQKLRPQVGCDPYLVVAVMGGTNIGKSTIFNHLAGCRASRDHHDATQTKHPVCLVPRGFAGRNDMAKIFREFQLRPWASEDDALSDGPDNLMIIREDHSGSLPDQLLLLDTPDVDGALTVNWDRARLVRHAADVLVCVLTQQKYNDAAIRKFFREGALSDKTVLIVFNMIHAWPDDEGLCRGWLETFQEGTGLAAAHVYAAPYDRKAVTDNRLPFHALSAGATDPRRDLSELHFADIKVRSLRGAMRRVLDDGAGLPAYLSKIAGRSSEYRDARDILRCKVRIQVEAPPLPNHLVMDEVWIWLEKRRTTFDLAVHQFYGKVFGKVGSVLCSVFRHKQSDPEEGHSDRELKMLKEALGQVLEKLELAYREANPMLRRELSSLLAGDQREGLFADLEARHSLLPLMSEEYLRFITDNLDAFERDHASLMKTIKWSLVGSAVIRPVITVAMFGGPIVLGELAGNAVIQTGTAVASQVATHAMTELSGQALQASAEVAAGAVVTVVGEGTMVGMAAPARNLIARLFSRYYQERAELLGKVIHDCVIGERLGHINRLASMADMPAHHEAWALVYSLGREMGDVTSQEVPPDAPCPPIRLEETTS